MKVIPMINNRIVPEWLYKAHRNNIMHPCFYVEEFDDYQKFICKAFNLRPFENSHYSLICSWYINIVKDYFRTLDYSSIPELEKQKNAIERILKASGNLRRARFEIAKQSMVMIWSGDSWLQKR